MQECRAIDFDEYATKEPSKQIGKPLKYTEYFLFDLPLKCPSQGKSSDPPDRREGVGWIRWL